MARTKALAQVLSLPNWIQGFATLGPASRRMALAMCLWGMGEGMWTYIRPLYITELGGNAIEIGRVLGIAGLAPVLLNIPVGLIVDRFGPRFLLLASWWIGTLSAIVLALAGSWQWLIPGFFMYAMSASAMPAINAYIAQDVQNQDATKNGQEIQRVISIVFTAYFLSSIISPMIGGWVGELFGLRVVFWLAGGWFLLSALTIHSTPVLPRSEVVTRPHIDTDSNAIVAQWWRFTPAQIRIYLTLSAFFFFMTMGYILAPQYVNEVRGLSVKATGFMGTAISLGGVLTMALLGSRHSRTALILGAFVMAFGFFGIVWLPGGFWQEVAMFVMFLMLGVYLAARTLSISIVTEYTLPEHRATHYAIIETVFYFGAFAGPLVAGYLYAVNPDMPFLIGSIAMLPVAIIGWFTLRPHD